MASDTHVTPDDDRAGARKDARPRSRDRLLALGEREALRDVFSHKGRADQVDDITMVVIRCTA